MNSTRAVAAGLVFACLVGASALVAAQQPTSKRQADAEWSQEGLRRVAVEGFDLVYVRPGAALGGYRQVQLEPVSVAFRRGWGKPSTVSTGNRVRPEDVQRIKEGLSALVQEQVREELTEGGYTLTGTAGEDVLSVELAINNLYINAPDLQSAGMSRVYTTSVGEMTLVAELRDSQSGELLGRIMDRAVGRESTRPQITTRADNVAEAKSVARAWARSLRNGLDRARTASDGGP